MTDVFKKFGEKYRYSIVVFKELVKTDFQLRYQGSFLGMAWSVLKPLMLFGVMYVVFVRFLKFTDGTPTFPISLLCGTCLWSFCSEGTSQGLLSIVNRGDLLRKVHFPNYIIVASTTMGSMISLGLGLLVVIVFGFFAHAHYTWRVLLVPFSILQLYCLVLGTALILATLYVYFRDVAHIWEVVLQALFYSIPIIYPLSMVAKSYPVIAKLLLLNPVAQPIMDIRHNLLSPEYVPTVWSSVNSLGEAKASNAWLWLDSWWVSIIPYICTFLILWLGIHLFSKYSQKFAEVL
ncbi:LPS ABC transporter [Bifidobacterium primatium]|uniref:LPS ABC transporter n=1 Tax=Bifidobacterium primatium TaxID=2045438 RepID=A0A2M9HBA8_9BIFI|nr:ABC transporter permease [Bifidobacterium primatium]PJM74071.1 LPS ABC transporter [Bifidobacterium primatium]